MIKARLSEVKYKWRDIIVSKKAPPEVVALFEELLNQIDARLKAQGKDALFVSQKNGFTGFCYGGEKAFAFIDLRQKYVSIVFFTGHGSIPGLTKGNWVYALDNKGSERVRVNDDASLEVAVDFACAAFDIAARY